MKAVVLAIVFATCAGHASEYVVDGGHDGYINGVRILDGVLLYGGNKPGLGLGIWTTDGGFALPAKIIDSSPPSGYVPELASYETVIHAGRLYFATYDGTHGCELWETDGTSEGTVLHEDIDPGPAGALFREGCVARARDGRRR